jgi:rhodanese-related sulfurtransferase
MKPGFVVMLLTTVLMAQTASLSADTVKGRIQYISSKANAIQLTPKGQPPMMVKFGASTEFVGAGGIKDLSPPDLIEVEYTSGEPATRITRVSFGIPRELEIDAVYLDNLMRQQDCLTPAELMVTPEEVERQMKRPGTCVLVDARPTGRYLEGHIPKAISIYAKDLPDKLDLLPEDKSRLVIFYCGGPTCPYTGESIKLAQSAGYTNLKGFQGGMPAWKKAANPVHASASWVAENLDENHVIIDVRPRSESAKAHIKTAVAMPAAEFTAMTETFIKERQKARLPGVSDTRAPIILYADDDLGPDVLQAYAELKKWKYKNVAIVEGGFDAWTRADLPTATGPAADQITYVRKLRKGAVSAQEFVELEKNRDGVLLIDVRSARETAGGTLQGTGAMAIPLDDLDANLDKLPTDVELITYCSNGIRSEMAYEVLKSKGYDKVRFLNETVTLTPEGSYRIE